MSHEMYEHWAHPELWTVVTLEMHGPMAWEQTTRFRDPVDAEHYAERHHGTIVPPHPVVGVIPHVPKGWDYI